LQEGYHTNQALIAIGSGGVFGLGPGKSRQKYAYLPEVATDSIFAILCEEFGFIGALSYFTALGYLVYKGFKTALEARSLEYKLLASGILFWLSAQSALNLGAITGILPLTGVPLPLISYGGSAIIFLLAGMGLVVNVSKR
jgi:cell division protein FtsW